jgi:undecaprenyl diphosphate synthase
MTLFRKHLESELTKLLENGIRLRAIGALERLPDSVLAPLQRDIESTKENKTLDLILAVSYGGREEIAASCRKIAEKVQQGVLAPEDVTVDEVARNLYAPDVPDPDLLIRSSGEQRISNFLLWQLAYSEIVVTPEYWPDFDEEVLDRCLADYAARERRFGLTSEQVREQRKRSSAGSA